MTAPGAPKASPTSPFAEVAALIANGLPQPEWLIPALERFSKFVGGEISLKEREKFEGILLRMKDATDCLIKFLPLFLELSLPIGIERKATAALDALPAVREALEHATKQPPRKGGPTPNVRRQNCAAIVIEAWKEFRSPEPRSIELGKACNQYWQACGGEDRDAENWRRDVERALKSDNKWIRRRLGLRA
jgi:hypothetical protein